MQKGESMEEGLKVIDGYLMVKLPEEIDHHQVSCISKDVDQILVSGKANSVVFDFEATRFMDSSGVGLIAGRYKKASLFHGKVYAVNVDRHIKRILYMSGLDKMIEMVDKSKVE